MEKIPMPQNFAREIDERRPLEMERKMEAIVNDVIQKMKIVARETSVINELKMKQAAGELTEALKSVTMLDWDELRKRISGEVEKEIESLKKSGSGQEVNERVKRMRTACEYLLKSAMSRHHVPPPETQSKRM
ncbi:MAG: hypothetical protein UV58_C0004G0036 [Candidatus Wolfebacteria bacterium GW2011_GWC1_43_10]|nr:MAG: hypothetical protein UV58_C0004G0036 [Candidatus Wolfebacteria bacterium GW2011_GWC1_43_10]